MLRATMIKTRALLYPQWFITWGVKRLALAPWRKTPVKDRVREEKEAMDLDAFPISKLERDGQADAFIFATGKDSCSSSSRGALERTAETLGMSVYGQDYRGTGYNHYQADDKFSSYSIKHHVQDFKALIEDKLQEKWQRGSNVAVAGHSLGGAIALWAIYLMIKEGKISDVELKKITFFSLNSFGDLDRNGYAFNSAALREILSSQDLLPDVSMYEVFTTVASKIKGAFVMRADDDVVISRHATLIEQVAEQDSENKYLGHTFDMTPMLIQAQGTGEQKQDQTANHSQIFASCRLPGTQINQLQLMKFLMGSNVHEIEKIRDQIWEQCKLDCGNTLELYTNVGFAVRLKSELDQPLTYARAFKLFNCHDFKEFDLNDMDNELCKAFRTIYDACYSYLKLTALCEKLKDKNFALTHGSLARDRLYVDKSAKSRFSMGSMKQLGSVGFAFGSAVATIAFAAFLWAPFAILSLIPRVFGLISKNILGQEHIITKGLYVIANGLLNIGHVLLSIPQVLTGLSTALVGGFLGAVGGFIAGAITDYKTNQKRAAVPEPQLSKEDLRKQAPGYDAELDACSSPKEAAALLRQRAADAAAAASRASTDVEEPSVSSSSYDTPPAGTAARMQLGFLRPHSPASSNEAPVINPGEVMMTVDLDAPAQPTSALQAGASK